MVLVKKMDQLFDHKNAGDVAEKVSPSSNSDKTSKTTTKTVNCNIDRSKLNF